MKNGDASARKVARHGVVALGCFAFIELAGVRSAQAESSRKVEGFELLGKLGYGAVVGDRDFADRESDPFGVLLGVDVATP